jgi:hypothetical protein
MTAGSDPFSGQTTQIFAGRRLIGCVTGLGNFFSILISNALTLATAVGPVATFWAFASILVLVMAFVIFFLPETKGRSLDANVEAEINAEINTASVHK